MSLASRGFHAICFNSETSIIPISIIQKLYYRFKHLILIYDVDQTGIESSLKQQQLLKDYDVKRLILPLPGTKESKDIADYFKQKNTPEDFRLLFLNLLKQLYSGTMAILKSCEVNFNTPAPISNTIISVKEVVLGSQGNLLCITGGEGTGKSNYIGSLISGSINNSDKTIDTLGITIVPGGRKAILLYDTEQSQAQLYKNTSNILGRALQNKIPCNLKIYNLSSMSRKQRLQAIIESMDNFYFQHKGIHLVVIDGVADLIKAANDEHESVAIIEELYRLAAIYNTCIVCVLHFIPNGMKLRGHLGSELQRKAAAILSIEKDALPGVSVVKALKVRDGSPLDVPLMQFAWSKDYMMHRYLGEKTKEDKEKRKENDLMEVAKGIFNLSPQVTYTDLCEQLQVLLAVKDRTAKSYIKFMRDKKIIIKDINNPSYYIKNQL